MLLRAAISPNWPTCWYQCSWQPQEKICLVQHPFIFADTSHKINHNISHNWHHLNSPSYQNSIMVSVLLLLSPFAATARLVRRVKVSILPAQSYLHLREVHALDAYGINRTLASQGVTAMQSSSLTLASNASNAIDNNVNRCFTWLGRGLWHKKGCHLEPMGHQYHWEWLLQLVCNTIV